MGTEAFATTHPRRPVAGLAIAVATLVGALLFAGSRATADAINPLDDLPSSPIPVAGAVYLVPSGAGPYTGGTWSPDANWHAPTGFGDVFTHNGAQPGYTTHASTGIPLEGLKPIPGGYIAVDPNTVYILDSNFVEQQVINPLVIYDITNVGVGYGFEGGIPELGGVSVWLTTTGGVWKLNDTSGNVHNTGITTQINSFELWEFDGHYSRAMVQIDGESFYDIDSLGNIMVDQYRFVELPFGPSIGVATYGGAEPGMAAIYPEGRVHYTGFAELISHRVVPEPGVLPLLALGGAAVLVRRRQDSRVTSRA